MTYETDLYRLPPGRRTPAGWDADGLFVPSDRVARQFILPNRPGPVAMKIRGPESITVRRVQQGTQVIYQASLPDFGVFSPTQSQCPSDTLEPIPRWVCWPIPAIATGGISSFSDVPGHEAVPAELLRWPFTSTGNLRIDALLHGALPAAPIARGDNDRATVELMQELLRGHGQSMRSVPGRKSWKTAPGGETFGTFGSITERRVKEFKRNHIDDYGFVEPIDGVVDSKTLRAMALEPASTPSPGAIYTSVVLDQPLSIWEQMVSMISTYEEHPRRGGFTAQTPKHADDAGLSYGILQWTHRSKRLATLLQRFKTRNQALFSQMFSVVLTTPDGLIAHCNDPTHLNPDGTTQIGYLIYDLFSDRWKERFQSAGLNRTLQREQVLQAVADIQSDYRFIKVTDATVPHAGYATLLNSQWAIGFWLDLTNQLGQEGGRTRYLQVLAALGGTPTERQILDKVVSESRFPERREYFRDRAPLSKTEGFPRLS